MPNSKAIRFIVMAGCATLVGSGLWPQATGLRAESYAPPLPADFTQDCRVDGRDLALLAARWLEIDDAVNLVGTSPIGPEDLAVLARQWLGQVGGACNECTDWQIRHPEWIFCDDFEDDTPLKRKGRYFDSFVVSTRRIGCLCAADPNAGPVPGQ